MSETAANNRRIAKNTLMLYIRQILVLLVSLYTVRVILEVLGVEDYGIYTVVGGVVSLFSFFSGTMASASQRFFSFALGQQDLTLLKKTFSVNLIIYVGIVLIAFILLETLGLWYVNERLKISPDRFEAACFVFHFSVLTLIGTILTTPFRAIIIAHEDMHIYAYLSIFDVIVKLIVVYLMMYISWDKLELYAVLLFVVSLMNFAIYILICVRRYAECQLKPFLWDKKLLVEISKFTGWSLFGQLSTVFRDQGVTILLNQMFNPVIVATKAITVNITSGINVFANGFNTGLYPPIIKYYANKEMDNMFSLIYNGSKISFFLMWVFMLPLFLEIETVLNLWLVNPPLEAVLFTRLALIEVLINSISLPIGTAARAPGKMRAYELSLGSIQIMIFFVTFAVLKMGGAAYSIFIVAIVANILMFFVRLFMVQKLIGLPISSFIKTVLIPVILIVFSSFIPSYFASIFLPSTILFSFITVIFCVFVSLISMYFIGLNKELRKKVRIFAVHKCNILIRFK